MINSCFYRYVARKYDYYKCVSLIFLWVTVFLWGVLRSHDQKQTELWAFRGDSWDEKVCLSRVENSERTGTANHTCADLQGNRPLSVSFARVCVCASVWVKKLNKHTLNRCPEWRVEHRADSRVNKQPQNKNRNAQQFNQSSWSERVMLGVATSNVIGAELNLNRI